VHPLAVIEQVFDDGSVAVPAPDRSALRLLGDRARPLTQAGERVLPAPDALTPLLPEGGLRRGSTVVAGGPGGTSLALALAGVAIGARSWAAVVGLPSLGLLGAGELGLPLERVVLVDDPPTKAWGTVVAGLLDAFEVVLVRPTRRLGAGEQRRLLARARDRGSVLIQAGGRTDVWAEAPDLRLTVVDAAWKGLGPGHGHLRARLVTVEVAGRRGAARPRRVELWLPGPHGGLAAADVDPLGRSAGSPGSARSGVDPAGRAPEPAPLQEVG
jgi:hypothetical protein